MKQEKEICEVLNGLADDVVVYIFQFLPFEDIQSIQLANKTLRICVLTHRIFNKCFDK
jgi:hypothetical protein